VDAAADDEQIEFLRSQCLKIARLHRAYLIVGAAKRHGLRSGTKATKEHEDHETSW
jgi:Arc/MetJ family transcription regulator